MTVLARASLRYLGHHPAQIVLSILGVALGVAVAVGIDLSSGSARRSFELSTRRLTGSATHRIVGGPAGVDERLYSELVRDRSLARDGLRLAPIVQGTVWLHDFEGPPLQLVGIDPFAEAELRPEWGAALPRDASGALSSATLPLGGRGVFASPGLAARLAEAEIERGGELRLDVESRRQVVSLAGELAAGGQTLEEVLLTDVSSAQALLDRIGRLDRIDVLVPAQGAAGAAARLSERLAGSGARLEPSSARAESLASMTSAFDLNLRALSLLAMIVGVFLVYNTMTFSVVQRRRLWGTLRTLGVTRGEVFRVVCVEALVVGALGTAAGLLLGRLLAGELVGQVTRSYNDLYFSVVVGELRGVASSFSKGAALGLGATLLGALSPAWEATTTVPRRVLARSELETKVREGAPRLAGLATLLTLVGGGLLWVSGRSLVVSYAAMVILLVAVALYTPAFTWLVCSAARRPLGASLGAVGRMAARGVLASLSRSSVAIAALSVAVAATAGIGIMVASFRGTLERWLDISLAADVYVSAPSVVASRNESTLSPEIVQRVLAAPAVDGHSTYRGTELTRPGGGLVFAAALGLDPRGRGAFDFIESTPEVWSDWQERDTVLVSEPLANRLALEVGSGLELFTEHGPTAFDVVGVYRDFSSDQGMAMFSRGTYERHWSDRGVSSLGLFLRPGDDADEVVEALTALLGREELVYVRSQERVHAASLTVFDRTFEVTSVLRLLAGAVAFIGVLSALLAMQLEREREVGVLRALGLVPRDVRKLVVAQSGLMGGVAGLLALPVGVILALVLTYVINARSFGWTLDFEVPPRILVETLALALSSALLAGLYPAWKMSRTSPARALRSE